MARRRRIDPTRTITLRRRFDQEMSARFVRLKGLIRTSIVDNSAFRTRSNQPAEAGQFAFALDEDKVVAFMAWLRRQTAAHILEVSEGTSVRAAAHRSWMNVYLRAAYSRGVRHAGQELSAAGANVASSWVSSAFRRPMHADRVGLIYIRAYEELTGVTATMAQQMSGVLSNGLVEGVSMRTLARRLNNRVDAIGIVRARMIARTETIRAHAQASLNAFVEAGIEGVGVEAEFTTAGDDAVCPQCEGLSGNVYSIEEARALIPVHPNCRCAFLPIVDNPKGIVLR